MGAYKNQPMKVGTNKKKGEAYLSYVKYLGQPESGTKTLLNYSFDEYCIEFKINLK